MPLTKSTDTPCLLPGFAVEKVMRNALANVKTDDYDRLIQLCDAIAGSEGVLDTEERMEDVKSSFFGQREEGFLVIC